MLKPSITLLLLKSITFLGLSYSTSVFAMGNNLKCSPVSEYHYKTLDKDLSSIQSQIETGPLFLYAKTSTNLYPSCKYENDDTGLLLIYQFNKSVILKNLSNSSIKFNSETLSLSSDFDSDEDEATAMLKAAETKLFGIKGCGINWKKPLIQTRKNDATFEKIWWGDTCSCKADLVFKANSITQISFQTTC